MSGLWCAVLVLAGHSLLGTSCPKINPLSLDAAYVTSYNWQLGGINTDSDPGHVASGLPVSEWLLDHAVACPAEWVGNANLRGAYTAVIIFPEWSGLGERWCVDTLGSEANQHPRLMNVPYYHGEFGRQWLIRFDVAARVPALMPLNQQIITGYGVEFRPLIQLMAMQQKSTQ